MRHVILALQALLTLFFLNSCKKSIETEKPSEKTQQILSDTAWLKLSSQSSSEWMGLFQNGIQDVSFNNEDSSLLVLTNTELVKLNKTYEVDKTIKLLNNISFSQIRFLFQNKITYSYSIYDGFENGIAKYKPAFCTQSLSQTSIETQNGYTKDPSTNLHFGLASIDENFRVFAVTNLTDNNTFARVQHLKNDKIISSTDIPNPSNKHIKAFNIKDNIGIVIGDNFYQITASGQLSNPITSELIAKEISPYKDGILVADKNRNANYLSHTDAFNCPFSDYIVSNVQTSTNEDYLLIRRSKVKAGEPFVNGELVFINNQTEKENIISTSSIRIEDIKAFWVINNTAYIMSNEGLFARMLK